MNHLDHECFYKPQFQPFRGGFRGRNRGRGRGNRGRGGRGRGRGHRPHQKNTPQNNNFQEAPESPRGRGRGRGQRGRGVVRGGGVMPPVQPQQPMQAQPTSVQPQRGNLDESKMSCFKCSKIGHISRNCPDKNKRKCYTCGGTDHLAAQCTAAGVFVQTEAEGEELEDGQGQNRFDQLAQEEYYE